MYPVPADTKLEVDGTGPALSGKRRLSFGYSGIGWDAGPLKRAAMIRAGDSDTVSCRGHDARHHSNSGNTKRQMIQKMK
jgi:hypothetical protein